MISKEGHEGYRIDLFMSVDIIGSTKYKFSKGLPNWEDAQSEGSWMDIIKKFYSKFNTEFVGDSLKSDQGKNQPDLWKALGDELIYRISVSSTEDVKIAIKNFIESIYATRHDIQLQSQGHLDLKGSAWIADFPARNIEIDLGEVYNSGESHSPDKINKKLSKIDYIGPSMDTGFRIGKISTRRKMAISVELALILSSLPRENGREPFKFGYDGREDLKGVLGGEMYPALWIDIENDQEILRALERENAISGNAPEITPLKVNNFCEDFMKTSKWFEFPFFKKDESGLFGCIPKSHNEYQKFSEKSKRKENSLYDENIGDEISNAENVANGFDDIIETAQKIYHHQLQPG